MTQSPRFIITDRRGRPITYAAWQRSQRRRRIAWAIVSWIFVIVSFAIYGLGLWAAAAMLFGIPAPR